MKSRSSRTGRVVTCDKSFEVRESRAGNENYQDRLCLGN